MSDSYSLEAALDAAITTIKPTVHRKELIEGLRALADRYQLSRAHTQELRRQYLAHFAISLSGPSVMVVLRSGQRVHTQTDPHAAVEHLMAAIFEESLHRFKQTGRSDWNVFWDEIAAEVQHVAFDTHHASARGLLVQLLLESARAQWDRLASELSQRER